jgi:hypothetical protein
MFVGERDWGLSIALELENSKKEVDVYIIIHIMNSPVIVTLNT